MAGCESGLTLTSIVGLVLLLILAGQPLVEAQKLSGAIDIVVVLNVGASSRPNQWPNQDHETNALKEAYAEFFPENFHTNYGNTRLGIVQLTETAAMSPSIRWQEKIVLNLTNDMNEFGEKVRGWKPNVRWLAYWPNIHQALRAIQEIRETSRNGRYMIVVMVITKVHHHAYWTEAQEPLKQLHKSGILFYVVVVGSSDRVNITQIKNESEVIASRKERMIVRNETALEKHDLLRALAKVKTAVIDDFCWPGVCVFFQKNSSCGNLVPGTYGVNCDAFQRHYCTSDDDCRRDCDEYWPWEPTDCNQVKCGTEVKRQGNEPYKGSNNTKNIMKKNCPQIKSCPACSSTSTSTTSRTTTITSSSTSSTTQSARRLTTSSSTITSSTNRLSPSHSNATSRSSTSTSPTAGQTTHGQSTMPPSTPHPTTRPPRKPRSGASPAVIYSVVGLIVGLVIVLIVVGGIVSMKKRKGTSSRKTKKLAADEMSRSEKGKTSGKGSMK